MHKLYLPESAEKLADRLRFLHEERKKLSRPARRSSLIPEERDTVLKKTAGRCHVCGGDFNGQKFKADHVLPHAAGGLHSVDNYLAAHGECNRLRWFYSPEEFQWILKMGVWARKQMEDRRTSIGRKMLRAFFDYEKAKPKRRKAAR